MPGLRCVKVAQMIGRVREGCDMNMLTGAVRAGETELPLMQTLDLGIVAPAIQNAHDFLDDRLADEQNQTGRTRLLAVHLSLGSVREPAAAPRAQVLAAIRDAHDLINWWWATPSTPVGRQAIRLVNDLRCAMSIVEHGLESVGGRVPKRAVPVYEIRRVDGDRIDSTYRTRAHAKGALDEIDRGRPLTFYLVDSTTSDRYVSFAGETELVRLGKTEQEFFASRDNVEVVAAGPDQEECTALSM
jgi:hypothetical protein